MATPKKPRNSAGSSTSNRKPAKPLIGKGYSLSGSSGYRDWQKSRYAGNRRGAFNAGHSRRVELLSQPRRAASIAATSIFFIDIIAPKARFASAPPAASAFVSARGVICQERPQRSLHQPHALSWPPLLTIAFQ